MNAKIKEIIKTLEGLEKSSVYYWINALLTLKDINTAEAGVLVNYFNLLRA